MPSEYAAGEAETHTISLEPISWNELAFPGMTQAEWP